MATVDIHRSAYNQPTFDTKYGKTETGKSTKKQIIQCFKNNCVPSKDCLLDKLLALFPFIMIMKNYEWKKWIAKDVVSGLCVGAVHIPQSMGFSLLTSLPPVYGLYSTFFPVIIYFFLGTSRHISMGTMAVISIMIGVIVDRESEAYVSSLQVFNNATSENGTGLLDEEEMVKLKVNVAVSVSCLIGLFQLGLSLLRLSVFATFMSSTFVGGFMTGAACHIITSQVPFGLGYGIPRQAGVFRVPMSWYLILKSIAKTNPGDIITFIICVSFLLFCKFINDKFQKKMFVPIPSDLLVLVIGTAVSYLANFHVRFGMRILKTIPTGMPAPKAPTFPSWQNYIVECFIIALVSYSISVSLAKAFSSKYKYRLDQNQELFALGVMHTVSSFFSCFAGAQAPPRTFIHENCGGKTQLGSLFSAGLILLVCLVIAPWFEPLPNCVLSAVIITALLPLFLQFKTMPHIWRVNKYDCVIWLVTFLSVVLLNVDYGLFIGLGVSLLSLVVHTHLAKGKPLTRVGESELYKSSDIYPHIKSLPLFSENVFIFKFDSPLYFANIESFKDQLFQATINPLTATKKKALKGCDVSNGLDVSDGSDTSSEPGSNDDSPNNNLKKNSNHYGEQDNQEKYENIKQSHMVNFVVGRSVILDCSMVCYIDLTALNTLKTLRAMYKDIGVHLLLVNCSGPLLRQMKQHDMDFGDAVYPSIQDAVAMLTSNDEVTTLL